MPEDKPDPRERPQRAKQEEHGAQSDQGRQRMSGGGPEPTTWEGPEEKNQQRRTKS